MLSPVEFSSIPLKNPSRILPFFHVNLPLVAPGINQSYMPSVDENGKMTMIHTEAARSFLEKALWHFRDQATIKLFDARQFQAISVAKERVPLEVVIRLHLPSLWRKDVDGPDKIILDALFKHFQFLAQPGCEKVWNDNRVVRLIVEKDVSVTGASSIEIEVRCALLTGK
jgi:hypothetical protein